jgi:hypothetical protein
MSARLTGGLPGRPIAVLMLALSLASGCAYDPPVAGDRNSAKFQADLTECRGVAEKAAHHAVISRFLPFISYPVSLPLKERAETRKCMTGKGYPLADASGAGAGRDSPRA